MNSDLHKAALGVRRRVFIEGQDVSEEGEMEFEEDSVHFVLLANNTVVGTVRYRVTENGVKLERLAVDAEQRGKGYGKALISNVTPLMV